MMSGAREARFCCPLDSAVPPRPREGLLGPAEDGGGDVDRPARQPHRGARHGTPVVAGAVLIILLATALAGCSSVSTPPAAGPFGSSGPASSSGMPSSSPPPGATSSDEPTSAASSTPPTPGAGCSAPASASSAASASTGPAADLVRVALSAPASATAGTAVTVTSRLVMLGDGPRFVFRPETSRLELSRAGVLVARTPAAPGTAVPLQPRGGQERTAQTLPTTITLVECEGSPVPPGRYDLRAVVGYGDDALNGAPGGF